MLVYCFHNLESFFWFVFITFFFFFKQNTTYEMRISVWSSDVFSSYLAISIRPGGCGLNDLPLVASAFLLGAKSMPRDCDCRPSIGYSCIDRSEERRVGKECVSTCRFRW